MRQAIEEGFILDVLRNYTSYKVAFNLALEGKTITEVDKAAALKGIMGWVRLHDYNIAQRVGIVVVAPKPYILGVCAVEGTADLVIKPLTALAARGIAGTARSAEGSLVLILDLEFLQARSQ